MVDANPLAVRLVGGDSREASVLLFFEATKTPDPESDTLSSSEAL